MRKIKLVFAILMMAVLGLTNAIGASGDIDYWDIYYVPGAPPSVSNQNDNLYVNYYYGGFKAYCSSISGVNGRGLEITAKNAGGLPSTVYVTTTGYTSTFYTQSAITGMVNFLVSAFSGYTCDSEGLIRINT